MKRLIMLALMATLFGGCEVSSLITMNKAKKLVLADRVCKDELGVYSLNYTSSYTKITCKSGKVKHAYPSEISKVIGEDVFIKLKELNGENIQR